jgi:hypothetical protein
MSPNPVGDRLDQVAQAIAARVVTLVVDALDLDALLRRIDVDAVVNRIDVEQIVSRVDVDGVVQRVDVDAIARRIDVNQLVKGVDIDALVSQTELGSIIAKSSTTILSEVLDVLRSQGVGVDDFLARWTNRLLRRGAEDLPVGPRRLVRPSQQAEDQRS